jgi:hypothetical protein
MQISIDIGRLKFELILSLVSQHWVLHASHWSPDLGVGSLAEEHLLCFAHGLLASPAGGPPRSGSRRARAPRTKGMNQARAHTHMLAV